jgi:addiction module HigA family antidote
MRSLRNPNRMPTHPGAVLREDVLPELGWTQTELAVRLMVSRQTVSDLLHERKSVTAELASHARSLGSLGCRDEVQEEPQNCTESIGCLMHSCKRGFLLWLLDLGSNQGPTD